MNGKRQILVKLVPSTAGIMVHNEDRSVDFTTTMTRAIEKKLKGARRAFFYADVEGSGQSARLVSLNASAPFQSW